MTAVDQRRYVDHVDGDIRIAVEDRDLSGRDRDQRIGLLVRELVRDAHRRGR